MKKPKLEKKSKINWKEFWWGEGEPSFPEDITEEERKEEERKKLAKEASNEKA